MTGPAPYTNTIRLSCVSNGAAVLRTSSCLSYSAVNNSKQLAGSMVAGCRGGLRLHSHLMEDV